MEELGKTIIIVLHDINMASQYADEIVAFKDGQVFRKGRTDQIMQADLLSQLYEIPITLADINGKRSVFIASNIETRVRRNFVS